MGHRRARATRPTTCCACTASYVDVGCDVISTDTWGLPTALRDERPQLWDAERPVHWMDVARRGVRLARQAAAEGGRARTRCAIAFSLNGDVDTPEGARDDPAARPRVRGRPARHHPARDALARARLHLRHRRAPARDRHPRVAELPPLPTAACAASTASTGAGPRATPSGARRGGSSRWASARCSINCIPPDHVGGMLSWMRDFTDLPLGAYPNLGYLSTAGWRTEPGVGGAEYAEMALRWRDEGAQIIGGCCGVGPEHVAAARGGAAGHRARPRAARSSSSTPRRTRAVLPRRRAASRRGRTPAARRSSRSTSPTSCASRACSCPPRAATWCGSTCSARASARDQRCLDVGCGTGLQTVQLARNGAAHVHAIDVDQRAVAEHAHERVPQRRRRPGQRRRGGPLPVGAGGALRRDRGQPLPDAGRPVRAGLDPPAARLLGPQPDRSPDRDAARGAGRRAASRT